MFYYRRYWDNQATVEVNYNTFNGFVLRFFVFPNQVMKWISISNDEQEYHTKNMEK